MQGRYYEEPPQIERGFAEHLVDATGRTYVDMVNNVALLGHAHPEMTRAVARQWHLLNTNSRFNYEVISEYHGAARRARARRASTPSCSSTAAPRRPTSRCASRSHTHGARS